MKPYTFILVLLLYGCVNRNFRDYQPKKEFLTCNLDEVSYAVCVRPIIISRCANCHNDPQGLDLTKYESLKVYTVRKGWDNKTISELEDRLVSNLEGYYMPYGGPKLADNELAAIKAWIAQGAKDN